MNSKKKTRISKSPSPSEAIQATPADSKESQPNTERPQQGHLVAISSEYHGPLPPPEMLAGYEKTLPGAADRIISIWEREAAFRHGIQTEGQTLLGKETKRGQFFTFITTLVVIGIGGYIAVTGNSGVGFALIITNLAGLAGLYIYGKERNLKVEKEIRASEAEHTDETPSEE